MKAGSQMLTRPSQPGGHRPSGPRARGDTPEASEKAESFIELDVAAVGVGLRFLELEASAQVRNLEHYSHL